MKLIETCLKDLYIIEPQVLGDNRGWFIETYNQKKLSDLGIVLKFVQDNHSFSAFKNTLRGIHFQDYPKAQTKLVRCTKGKILDIAVDLRKGSPTYLKYFSIELSEDNKKQLLIPRGFGHAFLTLVDNVEVQYKVDEFYSKEHDRSVAYNDSNIGIKWGEGDFILSEKDLNAKSLIETNINFIYKENLKL